MRSYIAANKRERLLFELKGKRRTEGIGRFCHRADELIIKSAVQKSGQYILKDLQDIDAAQIDKREVLDMIIGRGMPSIVVFDHRNRTGAGICDKVHIAAVKAKSPHPMFRRIR